MSTTSSTGGSVGIATELELRFHQELYEAAPGDTRRAMDWRCEEVDGALVSVARGTPSILFNRTLGLGVRRPANRETVERILQVYAGAGVERFFVHVGPEASPPDVGSWLVEQGLEAQRRWMKFERDARPAAEARTDLRIGRIEARDGVRFGQIVADSFDLGETAAHLFPALRERPNWHLLGAFDGDLLVAAGVMYVHEAHAYLSFGATAPTHRRRGAQGALLAARIEAARELGCTLLHTETGEEVPGEPQHSYQNIERAGFVPVHTMDNYARPR